MAKNLSSLGYVRLGVVTPELRVADIDFNTDKIIESIEIAANRKCHLLLFPELSVTGYTCADLFYQSHLLKASREAVNKIAEKTSEYGSTIIIGAPVSNGGLLFNCGFVISCGKILAVIPKTYLCNTNEYYEERWFSSEFDRRDDKILWDSELLPFGTDIIFQDTKRKLCSGCGNL